MTEIVLGPPGTGKTTTLLEYVDEELSRGTPPDRIAYVSFTKRAAHEAVTRACTKFKLEKKQFPYFRTLHSLCYQGLGLRDSDVMTDAKIQEFAEYAKVRVTGKWSDDGTFAGQDVGDRALRFDNMARVRRVPLRAEYNRDPYPDISFSIVERVASSLRAFKDAHGLLDYTDFLEEFLKGDLSIPSQPEVLLVDEAQDLSPLQWEVVEKLAEGCRRVIVAGDDDQAIFQWAGADVECLLRLEGTVRVLKQSWRVPTGIQEIALRLAGSIKNRYNKEWRARNASGTIDRCYSSDDIDLSGDDVLVLVRNEYFMRRLHSILRARGIVYEYGRYGHSSIPEKLLSAAEHWEQLRKGGSITIEQARGVYSQMSIGRGVKRGYKTLPRREAEEEVTMAGLTSSGGLLVGDVPWFEALDKLPAADLRYMQTARRHGVKLRERPKVRLSTIHTAKGAEAKHVVLLTGVARRSAKEADLNPDDELRVWYVGVTRAKERLTLVETDSEWRCPWL